MKVNAPKNAVSSFYSPESDHSKHQTMKQGPEQKTFNKCLSLSSPSKQEWLARESAAAEAALKLGDFPEITPHTVRIS